MSRPIAIDLFAGAGGLSLGLEQAGFDVAAAVEIDPIHAVIHHYNFPEAAVICRDVSKISGKDIRREANIGNKKVDLVVGGAPCQGFSMIGKRALDDPRNSLVREFVRIVKELDASYFVFENVKGLTVGRHKAFLEEVIASFETSGYVVQKPWKVLNAAEYSAPQNRQRLILLGAKKGLRIPEYPEVVFRQAGSVKGDKSLPEGPTCKDALGDLPDADMYEALLESDEIRLPKIAWKKPSEYAQEMRVLSENAWHYGYQRKWDASLLTSSMRAEHTKVSRDRFARTPEGKVEPISRFFKLPSFGVSNTLRAGTDAARGAFTSPRPIHYKYPRCITVREMARLHGFPDWFRFHETKWHGARQIGNAVSPPMARAIGKAILKAAKIVPQHPKKILAMGDDLLLRMNMRQASEFLGVTSPIGKRDRKNSDKEKHTPTPRKVSKRSLTNSRIKKYV